MSGLNMFTINPLTRKQIKRFKEIKRGYWSLMLLSTLLILSLCAEVLINSKALVVRYQGEYFFPIFPMCTQVAHLVWTMRQKLTIATCNKTLNMRTMATSCYCHWFLGMHLNRTFQATFRLMLQILNRNTT